MYLSSFLHNLLNKKFKKFLQYSNFRVSELGAILIISSDNQSSTV